MTDYDLDDRIPEVKTGDKVIPGDILAANGAGKKVIKAKVEGSVEVTKDKIIVTHTAGAHRDHTIPSYQAVEASNGDLVTRGQRLTEGSINLQDMLTLLGEQAVQRYIVSEVQSIYASQGQGIADKHIEIIIRQMFSRVQIEEPGDSLYVTGDIVSKVGVVEENIELEAAGKKPATYEQLLLPITKISISSDSFLSAASFQDTSRVLIAAAIRGKMDKLRGLKENVIIGRLIPVGTGFNVGGDAEALATVAVGAESDAQAGVASSAPDHQIDASK
jgi:DNA-directed RNA polymerase subunit beta'